jgi:D-alanyl-D-alanine carboxypeptidase
MHQGVLVLFSILCFAVFTCDRARADFASLVMDGSSGRILQEANADLPRYPASLTKMMTLYMLFEALEGGTITLDQRLSVSEHAASQPPTKLGLKPGQTIVVENAILALVTKSANDIAAVIAESLAGSEPQFAWTMTRKAHELGMRHTTFANASGLPDPDQVTTARDMAILGLALLHDFPQYYHYFGTPRFYYGGAVHPNHNRMLGVYEGMDGIKTGYTRASGFNLVASARRDGHRMIGVVMGARSPATRNAIMAKLLDQAFAGGDVILVRDDVPASPRTERTDKTIEPNKNLTAAASPRRKTNSISSSRSRNRSALASKANSSNKKAVSSTSSRTSGSRKQAVAKPTKKPRAVVATVAAKPKARGRRYQAQTKIATPAARPESVRTAKRAKTSADATRRVAGGDSRPPS